MVDNHWIVTEMKNDTIYYYDSLGTSALSNKKTEDDLYFLYGNYNIEIVPVQN